MRTSVTSPSVSEPPVTLLAIPESPRAVSFCHAAHAAGLRVEVVSWADFLTRGSFTTAPAALRLESPGRSWITEAKLLALGFDEPEQASTPDFARISPSEIAALGEPAGRIIAMRQW